MSRHAHPDPSLATHVVTNQAPPRVELDEWAGRQPSA